MAEVTPARVWGARALDGWLFVRMRPGHGTAVGLLFILTWLPVCSGWSRGSFQPGAVWPDSAGNSIQAHGGGLLVRSNVYYWYGEDRTPGGDGAVACYSSTNLSEWKPEGVVLEKGALPQVNGRRTFVERPKVIFNPATGKYAMWMHLEQAGYHFASAGIALSDMPTGPFTFLKSARPMTNAFEFETPDPNHQKELGGTFRDRNLFVDDDGRAYVFYASENNWTIAA